MRAAAPFVTDPLQSHASVNFLAPETIRPDDVAMLKAWSWNCSMRRTGHVGDSLEFEESKNGPNPLI